MRDNLREKLSEEITRKQFLQYLTGAVLMVLGLNNLISLLTGSRLEKHIYVHDAPNTGTDHSGFGNRSFGT